MTAVISNSGTPAQPAAFIPMPVLECQDSVQPARLTLRELTLRCFGDARDESASKELLTLLSPMMHSIASRLSAQWGVRDSALVSDLVQDICVKLCQYPSLDLPHEDGAARAYLRVMIANAARDSLRSRFAGRRGAKITVPASDQLDALAQTLAPAGMDRQILLQQIDAALTGTPTERAVFWLYYRQGLSAREIAAIPAVELSAKGVESLLHRLVERVKTELNRRRGNAG